MAFERHSKRWYAPRPSWGRGATINGKPAWQVAQERAEQMKGKTDA
jgi:hypothetical protein